MSSNPTDEQKYTFSSEPVLTNYPVIVTTYIENSPLTSLTKKINAVKRCSNILRFFPVSTSYIIDPLFE